MTTICRHIHLHGARCGSPSLRGSVFCYYHRTLNRRHPRSARELPQGTVNQLTVDYGYPVPNKPGLNLPALEDRHSIQFATSLVIGALASETLDTKRAAVLLYGLQVASTNAAGLGDERPGRNYLVTETSTDEGQELAPDVEPQTEIDYQQYMSSIREELAELEREEAAAFAEEAED